MELPTLHTRIHWLSDTGAAALWSSCTLRDESPAPSSSWPSVASSTASLVISAAGGENKAAVSDVAAVTDAASSSDLECSVSEKQKSKVIS